MSADARRAGELRQQLSDQSLLLGRRRRRRAAEQLATLARSGTPEAIAALAQALASSADEEVREIASSALRAFPEGPAQEALCRLAVEEGDAAALTIAMEAAYVPSEPPLRAALLALSGRWAELEAFDLDNVQTGIAYEAASPGLRRRLAAAAREAGRGDWVQVTLGGREQRRLAAMTLAEWQDVAALVARPEGAAEAWRLATAAPPFWARTLLLGIGEPGALPEGEREDFARLRALAALCGDEEIPLSAPVGCVAKLSGHENWVSSLAVTPDGSLLLSGSGDKTIRLWRLPGAECAGVVQEHDSALTSLAITPDGSLLASGSDDDTILLWSLPGGESVATLQRHKHGVNCLAITPNGSLLAAGSHGGTIRLWSLPSGKCVATLRGHEYGVRSLAVTPDGSLLASGSDDNTIRLWRLPGGEHSATLPGHERWLLSLAVTPDGSLLASASGDKTIRLWSLPGGQHVATLRGHEREVSSLAISPDGTLLASASADQTIRLWRSEIATLAATPIAALARDHDRLLTLQRDAGVDGRGRAWLDFMLALVARHRRYDIEIAATTHVTAAESDIVIGE